MILGLIFLFTDCKKKKIVDVPAPDFTVAGDPYVHSFVSFKSNQPDGVNLSWDLGDATTTYEQIPVHKYFVPGTYTVTLTANGKTQSKAVIITLGQDRIGRSRVWTRISGFADASGDHLLDSTELTATLDMPNDSTVIIPGDNNITQLKDPVSVYYNDYKSPVITYRNATGEAKLSYYADRDSISIFRFKNVTSPVQGSYYTSLETK